MSIRNAEHPIRVLVVDDSSLACEMICAILNSEPGVSVVGKATNGLDAVSMVASLKPDLVTMDIEMPIMGGLDAIERIMRENPLPILVVTAQGGVRTAFAAVSKGALDVVEKPDISLESGKALLKKVRMLANVDLGALVAAKGGVGRKGSPTVSHSSGGNGKIVAIASSTGGPQAIHSILSRLPADFPAPIVIAQHIADGFTQGMVEWFQGSTALKVCLASNGARLVPGAVYVNPAELTIETIRQEKLIMNESHSRGIYHPSCDALLGAVASAYNREAVGVILSGMGDDGVDGISAIKAAGGVALAQDSRSSVVFGMNRLAIEAGHIDRIVSLADMPAELLRLVINGQR